MDKFYVYGHYKKDTSELFYIGKGCGNRAWSKQNRSEFWKKIVTKYDYDIKLLDENLTEADALLLESMYIEFYGKRSCGSGILCNIADGGTIGPLGAKLSESQCEESRSHLARKVICVELNKCFWSLKSAERFLQKNGFEKADYRNIFRVCNKETPSAYGYEWRYVNDCSAKRENLTKRKVKCVDVNLIFSSIKEAAEWASRKTGLGNLEQNLGKCCSGLREKCYGYRWEYINV